MANGIEDFGFPNLIKYLNWHAVEVSLDSRSMRAILESSETHRNMFNWTLAMVGNYGENWKNITGQGGESTFLFERKEDAALFALTWT